MSFSKPSMAASGVCRRNRQAVHCCAAFIAGPAGGRRTIRHKEARLLRSPAKETSPLDVQLSMTHHFVAEVRTTAGPLKIGISDIPAATIGPAFQALMTTLAQVSDPILPEDPEANIEIYEVLDRSPKVAMQFEYLGRAERGLPSPGSLGTFC